MTAPQSTPAKITSPSMFQPSPNLAKRYKIDRIFEIAALISTIVGLVVLAVLLTDVVLDGLPRLSLNFLTNYPSRKPEQAGILSPLVGTIWLLLTTAAIAFPIGVGAGIFLEEFAADTLAAKIIEINIANLAGVPSIIYGLLGLEVFVRIMEPITKGRSILAGALTLALLILPIIIVATRESLRAIPNSLRMAGYALGATRWQVISEQILPLAIPGILTGTILALSRAIGETAPLIAIGALTFIAYLPHLSLEGFQTPFTALPIQIYNWVSRPQVEFHTNAAAGIIVLMVVLLLMNTTAIILRNKFQKAR
ncbi:MAG TPA: phosphate ABC transporter permease PstA [Oscillatoriaceae cyanobacterium M33_DOE_052]|uniref:Phosphate transport system permease protein PstA n=1 Tax=Planktothricoides sp. SpSt-374 TaxID=2282167 RepID=A0A7C3ZK52_9CYAN|nr:phosphate ABC transporter permease PstA [Oscillatoriaceae cyanobacterium M33_DOE_052]